MARHDYAFPFRIDPGSRQAAQTAYASHVEQMIRQVLLTSPGERGDLPEFGCGLRQLIFAPHSGTPLAIPQSLSSPTDPVTATTQLIVQQALNRWLAGQIQVQKVTVIPPGGGLDDAQLLIQIDYVLIETLANARTEVRVS